MKVLAILIMLTALFLLYRIACPKQADTKKGNDTVPPEKPESVADAIGKSRFVLPARSKPLQTPATSLKTEKGEEKALIFAVGIGEKPSGIIPENELDGIFGNAPNPEILSIPLERETDYEDEEAEELNGTLGYGAIEAEGVGFDELQTAVQAVTEQPDEVSEETGKTIVALENTGMFERLVSGDEGKMNWIKAVVERHIQNTMPEAENETSGTDDSYGDFDVAGFLS
jgi:hypothetical protein